MELDTGRHRSGQGRLINCGINRALTQFLSPRLFMNTGATAAAVAYDCAGVYVETDFQGGGRIHLRR